MSFHLSKSTISTGLITGLSESVSENPGGNPEHAVLVSQTLNLQLRHSERQTHLRAQCKRAEPTLLGDPNT